MNVNHPIDESLMRDFQADYFNRMDRAGKDEDRKRIQETAKTILQEIKRASGSADDESLGEFINVDLKEQAAMLASNTRPAVREIQFRDKVENIVGDGHCCFRSVAHALVDLSHKDKAFISKLEKMAKEKKQSNPKLSKEFENLITLLPKGRRVSNELQQCLRNISCSFYEEVAPLWVKNEPGYFAGMKGNDWGSEIQLTTFTNLFGIRIDVQNEVEKGKIETFGKAEDPVIRLQYTGNHYNNMRE